MNDYQVRPLGDGNRVEVVGVETGELTAVVNRQDVLVLHEAGHRYWTGLGKPWAYAPAEFWVLVPTGKAGRWRRLAQFPVRWR